jgi:hypothetical protein
MIAARRQAQLPASALRACTKVHARVVKSPWQPRDDKRSRERGREVLPQRGLKKIEGPLILAPTLPVTARGARQISDLGAGIQKCFV